MSETAALSLPLSGLSDATKTRHSPPAKTPGGVSMPVKISKALKERWRSSDVAPVVGEYERRISTATGGGQENRIDEQSEISELYYDLVTDFYEYGWGRSFHFAHRVPGESFKTFLIRHEHYMAELLGLSPGMLVADLGCGIGGPLLQIAHHSGARIVGINNNDYQLQRARLLGEESGLTHPAQFMHCDYHEVDATDETFDAVYSIEATCHAPDKASAYGEAYRLLKPGSPFAAYEYCMTDRFDPENPLHLNLKAGIQLGGGLVEIDDPLTVDNAIQSVGFEAIETPDLAVQTGPSVPWHQPLVGSRLSLDALRSSRIGRWLTQDTMKVLETLHIAPQGTVRVSKALNLCAASMVEADRLGIFTPMYLVYGRKPA